MRVRGIIEFKGGTLYTATLRQPLLWRPLGPWRSSMSSLVVIEAGKIAGLLTFREVMLALRRHGSAHEA